MGNSLNCILLDIDGVLADFFGGVCKIYGKNPEEVAISMNYRVPWDLSLVFSDFTGENVVKICSEEFWANLDIYPWANLLIQSLRSEFPLAKIQFCTSAGLASTKYFINAINGKLKWLKKHFPDLIDTTVFCHNKRHIIGDKTVLIDDNPVFLNTNRIVPFPQWWNDYRDIRNKSSAEIVDYVITELKRFDNERHCVEVCQTQTCGTCITCKLKKEREENGKLRSDMLKLIKKTQESCIAMKSYAITMKVRKLLDAELNDMNKHLDSLINKCVSLHRNISYQNLF